MYKSLSADWAESQQGDYIVVNNVWGKFNLTSGHAYTQTISIADDKDLTSGISMNWDWNADPSNTSVLAYPEISVGYKPWDDPSHGTTSLSSRIRDIRAFAVTHDLAISGDIDKFNVSYDLWLTNKPLGDESTITTELMIWTHKGGPDDFGSAQVGTYKQGGVTFDIVTYANFGDPSGETGNHWRYIALVPQTDLLDKTIDVKAVFNEMMRLGYVSEMDYLTGYELGAEITGGTGGLTVNDISYNLERFGATSRANSILGSLSSDRIFGLGGNDTIIARKGNDFISGGTGNDTLTGGIGKDTFYFNEPGKNWDTITDFAVGLDKVGLDADTFSAFTGEQVSNTSFARATTFANEDVHLLYNAKSGKLYYDADGSGTADAASLVAVFENHVKLTYSDFIVL